MPGFSINTDVDVDVNDPRAGVYNDTYSMDVKKGGGNVLLDFSCW